ncbi:5-dehydro-4-deoxyglucarate dehydratase [Thalassobaculum sp.]|uniref:5-dehydro-4-deoxyglucarate dehydratase n=1 Tax=Thalassobaculum sp. TaxID=2022740 RepID=UPI0032ED38FC
MASTPEELKLQVGSGLLSFPVTDFAPDLSFDRDGYAARLDWLGGYGAAALFAAGGTGEMFSLTPGEYPAIVETAVQVCRGRTPIIAGVGYGTRLAVEMAAAAEAAGADGLLVLPQYLITAEQEGLFRHIKAICDAVKIGVIVYNRDNCLFAAETVARLAEACPNLIGYKDGSGDIERMVRVRRRLGDRVVYVGGLPTAEVYAEAYDAMGVTTYSSAVFNFIPETALTFYAALRRGDGETVGRLLTDFFLPYIAIRDEAKGYAVSIVKAGARLVGRDAGPVRPPLLDLNPDQLDRLGTLIRSLGAGSANAA